MEKFYLIILVLYSDDLSIYEYNKLILQKYMNTEKEILTLMVTYDKTMDEDVKLIKIDNLLLIKGEEQLDNQSIFNKTLKAIKFCYDNYDFNYILRTNISTFWVYDNLLNFLKLDNRRKYIYGWLVNYLNDKGIRENFISGTGIIIARSLVPLLFTHTILKCDMDDIEISQHYLLNGVELKNAIKHNPDYLIKFEYDNIESIDNALNTINDKNICFRVKSTENRDIYDKYVLDNLLVKYYYDKLNIDNIDRSVLDELYIKNHRQEKIQQVQPIQDNHLNQENRLNKKLLNIQKKKKIILFVSGKASEYSGIVVDIIKTYVGKYTSIVQNQKIADVIISHITDRRCVIIPSALNIVISGESRDTDKIYDIYVGTRINTKAHMTIYFPYLYISLLEHKKSINSSDYKNTREKFCAYMYSHDVPHRVEYFNLLNGYKKVDGIGKSCNNMTEELNLNINSDETYLDKAVQIYTKYKFVLALENHYQEGYFTEKIINPIIAGSIPIYWGTDDVFKYINKKRVIYVHDFKNNDELLKKIIEIDNSDEEYNNIIKEPVYIKKIEEIFSNFETNIKNLFSK